MILEQDSLIVRYPIPTLLVAAIASGLSVMSEYSILVVMIIGGALECYEMHKCIRKDEKNGSCRNMIRKFVDYYITALFGYVGFFIGAIFGPLYYPGIGAAIGILLAEPVNNRTLNPILDYFKLDIYPGDCEECGQKFEYRRYLEGEQKMCYKCRIDRLIEKLELMLSKLSKL